MLSGGERNRLLLAKLFAKPSNLLIMDEPTNDLDAETLDLVEEMVADYAGTLLLVSHDRAFLDNVVTSTLVFDGGGRIDEYVGGYSDSMRQRAERSASVPAAVARRSAIDATARQRSAPRAKPRKLSFNEQRELKSLPGRHRAARGRADGIAVLPERSGVVPGTAGAGAQRRCTFAGADCRARDGVCALGYSGINAIEPNAAGGRARGDRSDSASTRPRHLGSPARRPARAAGPAARAWSAARLARRRRRI